MSKKEIQKQLKEIELKIRDLLKTVNDLQLLVFKVEEEAI